MQYEHLLDRAINIIKENSSENPNLNLTLQIIKKYISDIIEFGYIDYVNFNSVIKLMESITIEFKPSNDPFTISIDFNNSEENIIIDICVKVGEYLLNMFHKENITKFSLLATSTSRYSKEDIADGLLTINKALSYELAYQVFEYQTKCKRKTKDIKTNYYPNGYTTSWYKDSDIEESVKLFLGYLYRSDKEDCMNHLSRKSFDKFLHPQIINTKLEDIDILLVSLGYVRKSFIDNSKLQYGLEGARILEQKYNQVKIPLKR